ncbi:hypothetical protein H0A61_02922 [Koleobacter methoxysyntrophicus]|uniref:Uncharacterized protein n=1 Tax=Koleobacter methoxysyntrophicus TaxID=2751313 RepID=A0A8A0RRA0_9FIRM|nr:hypothetical protein H0A61_02922 [Koleobacter methoxysyntrophicus]
MLVAPLLVFIAYYLIEALESGFLESRDFSLVNLCLCFFPVKKKKKKDPMQGLLLLFLAREAGHLHLYKL